MSTLFIFLVFLARGEMFGGHLDLEKLGIEDILR
jgi:hypothetical protein